MEGHLVMSLKERQRLATLFLVASKQMSVAAASTQLCISRRQCRRILRRYEAEGDAGLVHRGRGKASGRSKEPAFKSTVLELCRKHYEGFGPTLASEKLLERDGHAVHPETLRLWLIADGQWEKRGSRHRHRSWRERKAHFGEMVQLDGSDHKWFGDRGLRCFLMTMVDDATGHSLFLFSEQETTFAAMELLEMWVRLLGIPASLYVDRKNVYVTDREQTLDEQLTATPPLTQFGRACHLLGIRIIEAHSPQAKGRVERKHGVSQDRLVKELALENVSDIVAANKLLQTWTPSMNRKFAVAPRSDVDLHRPVPKEMDLRRVFCLQSKRVLRSDYTVQYGSRWFQIEPQKLLQKPGSPIIIREWQNGAVHLYSNEQQLAHHELPGRPHRLEPAKKERRPPSVNKPAQDHPWRKSKCQAIQPRELQRESIALAEQYFGPTQLSGRAIA